MAQFQLHRSALPFQKVLIFTKSPVTLQKLRSATVRVVNNGKKRAVEDVQLER